MTEIPDRRVPGGGADNVPVPDLLPEGYAELLDRVKRDVLSTRLRAMRTANTELIALNWRIGRLILERQRTQPWGSAVIRRLALDLRREFPDMTGLSATNLQYMRAFAAAWPTEPISPQAVLGTRQKVSLTGEPSPNYDTGEMFSVPLAHAPTLRLWAFGDSESTPRRRGATTASSTTNTSPTNWPRAGWRCGSSAERSRRTPVRRTPPRLRCS